MTTDPGVHDARAADAALLDATAARERLAGRTRWMRPFYLVMAAGTVAVALVAGLADLALTVTVTGAFVALVLVLCIWVLRQGVVRRGTTRLHTTTMIAWSILYGAALQVGVNAFPGVVGYWVPAALVVASPCAVAAVVAGRSSDVAGRRAGAR